jgi:hypothetical protein
MGWIGAVDSGCTQRVVARRRPAQPARSLRTRLRTARPMTGHTLSPVQPIRGIDRCSRWRCRDPKRLNRVNTEITFAVLSALTWRLLSWFGRFEHGRVPALLWVLVALFLAFSYSMALNGKWLRKAAWRSPRHWLYWPAGIVSGLCASSAVAISQAIAKKPPAPRDPRLS